MTKDLLFASAVELSQLVCQGKISAVELLEEHLQQIKRINPTVNAVVTLDEEGALSRAREADAALARGENWGPLHGVPMTVKDTYETAGMRTTAGFPPLKDYLPEKDATAVARLKAAGANLIGKTNMPVLAMDGQTNNPIFGPTNNPWNLAYNVGGSSGGSAAALAAGMVPLELGSDIAGSLRLPAHSCGVLGFKPTERRVSGRGHVPPPPGFRPREGYMACFGPMARSVDDLVLGLQLIAGPDEREWEIPPVPLGTLPNIRLGDMRFAWSTQFGEYPATRDTKNLIESLVSDLQSEGCLVDQAPLEAIDFAAAFDLWVNLVTPPPDKEITLNQFGDWMVERYAMTLTVNRLFQSYDALLCPVAMRPAFPHCEQGTPLDVDGNLIDYTKGQIWYSAPFNITGHPAVSIPLGLSSEGLPIGLQVVGKRWDEMKLLAIAGKLVELTGGFRIPPGMVNETA